VRRPLLALLLAVAACADADAVGEPPNGSTAATESAAELTEISLTVPDMACPLCANAVRAELRAIGVQYPTADLATKRVTGRFDPARLSADDIRGRIEASGFRVTELETR
jgi:copper chaperone CopZ